MQRHPVGQLLTAIAISFGLLLAPLAAATLSAPAACRALIQKANIENEMPASGYAAVRDCLPQRAELWEQAGHAALQAKQAPAAISYLETARQLATQRGKSNQEALSLQGMEDLAEAYRMDGDLPAALEVDLWLADRTGLDPILAEKISQIYLTQGDFAGAAATWQRLSDQQPENAEAQYQSGLLLATQEPESALPALEKAARLDASLEKTASSLRQAIMGARLVGDPAYTLLQAGRALATIDRWDLAAEAFRQSILAQPNYAEAWAFLGEARQHLSSPNMSAKETANPESQGLFELQTALELDPQSLSTNIFLALFWKRHGDYNQALEAISRAILLSPDNPALITELAGIQAVSGDLYGAYDTYTKAATLSPYDPEYRRRIIRFSLEYNFNVEEVALPLARQLLSGERRDPIDLDLMAQVLILQGDLSSAEQVLIEAISADPRSAAAHLHLGLIYLLRGNSRAATSELQSASALDPGGPVDQQVQRLLSGGTP